MYNRVVVDDLDQLFSGLADPTRRDILRRCAIDAPSVSRLAEAYPMSFAAVQKHVAVLERAGLVAQERRGRARAARAGGRGGARGGGPWGARGPRRWPGHGACSTSSKTCGAAAW